MFLGLPQPLHWAAVEKESQRRFLTKDKSDSLAETQPWIGVCLPTLGVLESTALLSSTTARRVLR